MDLRLLIPTLMSVHPGNGIAYCRFALMLICWLRGPSMPDAEPHSLFTVICAVWLNRWEAAEISQDVNVGR